MQPILRNSVVVASLLIPSTLLTVPTVRDETLVVNDPRPLAQALLNFERAHGFAVTYEDPMFVHPSDMVNRAAPSATIRDLIPRGGSFTATFDPPQPDATEAAVSNAVATIVDQYNSTGYPGRFRTLQSEHFVHVVPSAVIGVDGVMNATTPVLDTVISIPGEKGRNLFNGLRAIMVAIGDATGQKINIGTVPTNLFMQSPMENAATNIPARNLIVAALRATGRDLSWRLLYGPGDKFYALNIHIVNTTPSK
jgi:hypothetical protein